MIRFKLDAESQGDWMCRSGGGWQRGESWIEPYDHPCLEAWLVNAGDGRWQVVVRERLRGEPAPLDPAGVLSVEQLRSWPLDWLAVCGNDRGQMRLDCGSYGIAPLWVAERDTTLYGSWDPSQLISEHAQQRDLVALSAVRSLSMWLRYSTASHFDKIHRLTERATMRWNGRGVTVDYPTDALHPKPRVVSSRADVVGGLGRVMGAQIASREFDPDSSGVTLSGGMDSAAVAVVLGGMYPRRVRTAAMLIPGRAGVQQRARREEMINKFRLLGDIGVDAMRALPMSPESDLVTGRVAWPDIEIFSDAIGFTLDSVRDAGVEVAFGGVGGDEALALSPAERGQPLTSDAWTLPSWLTAHAASTLLDGEGLLAPASVVPEVTLLGFAGHHLPYLRRGIWPIQPFASPDVLRACQWLPQNWRRRKLVLRQLLRRQGTSQAVYRPALRENLTALIAAGLRLHGIPMLIKMVNEGLLLAELGLVDADKVVEACRDNAGAADETVDGRLYPLITMELALRRLPQ